jgi:hypothetical protein
LNSHSFEPACLQHSLDIFAQRTLDTTGKRLIVESFVPFLHDLEATPIAQERMVEILNQTESPALLLVAAAVLRTPIPFANLKRTYDEVISAPITAAEATEGLRLFGQLILTASWQLIESMLAIASDLLTKFELLIDWRAVGPLYRAACAGVAHLNTAPTLLDLLIRIDPGTPMDEVENVVPDKFVVAADIAKLVEPNTESVTFTNCKKLSELRGMIEDEQGNIYPFVAQHDMYLSLKGSSGKGGKEDRIRTNPIMRSTLSIVAVNKSVLLLGVVTDFSAMPLPKLGEAKIQMSKLEIEAALPNSDFVLSFADFGNLANFTVK